MCIVTIVHAFYKFDSEIKQSLVWNVIKGHGETQDGHVYCHHCPTFCKVDSLVLLIMMTQMNIPRART